MSVQIKQNADASVGLQGTDLDDGGFMTLSMPYSAVVNTAGNFLICSGHVLNRRAVVKAITGCVDATASVACTLQVWRAPSGTALGSGTLLHTGSFNLQGTVNTNQALALAALASTLDIPAGTRIGFIINTSPTSNAVGVITVTLAPA